MYHRRVHIKNTAPGGKKKKYSPWGPTPNPLSQALRAQESEFSKSPPLTPKWVLAARSSFQTLCLEFPPLPVSLLVSLLLECIFATLNNYVQHSPNAFQWSVVTPHQMKEKLLLKHWNYTPEKRIISNHFYKPSFSMSSSSQQKWHW